MSDDIIAKEDMKDDAIIEVKVINQPKEKEKKQYIEAPEYQSDEKISQEDIDAEEERLFDNT